MNDKEFRDMSLYKEIAKADSQSGAKRLLPLSFYEKYIIRGRKKAEYGKEKSAIWWMIMIFCVVYGFETIYKVLITIPIE